MGAAASLRKPKAAAQADGAADGTRPAEPVSAAVKPHDRLRMLKKGMHGVSSSSKKLLHMPAGLSNRKLATTSSHQALPGVSQLLMARSRYSLQSQPRFSIVSGGGCVLSFRYDATVNLLPLDSVAAAVGNMEDDEEAVAIAPVSGRVDVIAAVATKDVVGVLVAGARGPDGQAPKSNVLHLFLPEGKYASSRFGVSQVRFSLGEDGAVVAAHPADGAVLLYTVSKRAGYHVERLTARPTRYLATHVRPETGPPHAFAVTKHHVLGITGRPSKLVVWKRGDTAELGAWDMGDPLRELSSTSTRRLANIRDTLNAHLRHHTDHGTSSFLLRSRDLRRLAKQCQLGPLASSALRRALWVLRPRAAGARTRRRVLSSSRPAYVFTSPQNAVVVERASLVAWMIDLKALHSWSAASFRPAHFSSMIQSLAHRRAIEPRHPRITKRLPDHVTLVECATAHATMAACLITFQRGSAFERWAAGAPAPYTPRRVELQVFDLTNPSRFSEPAQSLVLDDVFQLVVPPELASAAAASGDESGEEEEDSEEEEEESGAAEHSGLLSHLHMPHLHGGKKKKKKEEEEKAEEEEEKEDKPEVVLAEEKGPVRVTVAPARPNRRGSMPSMPAALVAAAESHAGAPEVTLAEPKAVPRPSPRARRSSVSTMAGLGLQHATPEIVFEMKRSTIRGPKVDEGAPDVGMLRVALLGRKYCAVLHTIEEQSEVFIFYIGHHDTANNEPIARIAGVGTIIDIKSAQSKLMLLNAIGGVSTYSIVQQGRQTKITKLFTLA